MNKTDTHSAEYFLQLIKRQRRGKFKIYIGMIAGVGKSYRMLCDAHDMQQQGVDVQIGYIETHGRPGTKALIDGLTVIPRKQVYYKGKLVEEMDVDAIVARHPEVVIVDELAHSNIDGSRNAKRWQDVMNLLDAGINVISAVNIQHIESLNEEVHHIVGIDVGERIPDTVLREADEVVNIDLTAEELLDRLKAGKIYRKENIQQALDHFFQTDHILRLRELALKEVAFRVEKKVLSESSAETQQSPTKRGPLLACISSHPTSPRHIIRRVSRLAEQYDCSFLVLYVQTPHENTDNIPLADQRHLLDHFKLVAELGGKVVERTSPHVLEAIIDLCHEQPISTVCLGQPAFRMPRILWDIKKYRTFLDALKQLNTDLIILS